MQKALSGTRKVLMFKLAKDRDKKNGSPKGFADLYAARTVHLRFIAASGAEQSAS